MNRRIVVATLAVLGGVGWYLFRPELLFLDKQVNEELTATAAAQAAAQAGGAAGPVALAAGSFHSVAHETRGTAIVLEVEGKRVLRLTDFHAPGRLFCGRQTGGLREATRIAGGRDVRARHVRCVSEGDAFCEWEVRWASA